MKSNWQADFFHGVGLECWRRCLNPEQTRAEVDFLAKVFGRGPGAHLLDVACGNGHHTIEFASRGYSMTGLDSSEEFLAEARQTSPHPVRWLLSDMREIDLVAEFDGGYCFGNSFGYNSHDDVRQVLARLARALKPGARFAIETGMTAESILPGLLRTRWYRLGDMLMLSENQYHPAEGRLDIQYTFVHNGVTETRPTASYVFTAAEMCRMHREAGLQPVELAGSIGGEPYQLGSPRLILISEKG